MLKRYLKDFSFSFFLLVFLFSLQGQLNAADSNHSTFDFDGDEIFDITWKNRQEGVECIYLIKNGQAQDLLNLGLGNVWAPLHDINNDGKDDIVRVNMADSTMTIFLMDGTQLPVMVEQADFALHPELDLSQLETIDFGKPLSLLLQDTVSGQNYLWLESLEVDPAISLTMSCVGASQMRLSETADLSQIPWETYQENKSFILSNADGIKTIYAQFTNASGQIINATLVTVVVNRLTPNISITNPSVNITVNADVFPVTGEINAPYLKLLVNGNEPQVTGNIFTYDLNLVSEVTTVFASVLDLNGNIALTPTLQITQDLLPPQEPAIDILENLTRETTVTLKLSAIGATQMRFSDTPVFDSEWETYAAQKEYELSPVETLQSIYVQYRDDALNQSEAVFDSIQLDLTGPVVTITSPVVGVVLDQKNFLVEGTINEPCEAVFINNQPATINGNTFSVEIIFAKGENWLTPRAIDVFGNEALSSSMFVEVDFSMPKSSPLSGDEAYRINCGEESFDYTDPNTKNWWCQDEEFYSLWRWGYLSGEKASTTNAIIGAQELEPIYQSSRWGKNMHYKVEVPDGEYELTLMFAETWFENPGQRVFDVQLENDIVWSGVDIIAGAGGQNIAYNLTTAVTVTDKCLDIIFPENLSTDVDAPSLCGIELKVVNVSDEGLLDFLQKKFFWLYWNACDQTTGLVEWGANNWEYEYVDVSSSAITGFALSSYTIGAERGWITPEMAYDRIVKILNTYESIQNSNDSNQTMHGLFYHWVYLDSGSRANDSEISTVDSALLILGALQAGEYFKNISSADIGGKDPLVIAAKADQLYRNMDWEWFTGFGDAWQQRFISMGWKPTVSAEELANGNYIASGRDEGGYYCNDWWNRYSEGIFVNFLAFGSPTHWNVVNNNCWEDMARNWVDAFGYGFIQEPPLFTHQYHHFYYDLSDISDNYADYFLNTTLATLANRQTCIEDERYENNIWGLTASGGPDGQYHVYGGAPNGGHDGTVSPSAAITSIMVTPSESIAAAREVYFQYKHRIWGRYGFCDAFNVDQDWRHWAIEGLNLGAMIIAIENYRSGMIKDTFMQNQYVQPALVMAGFKPLDNVSESSFYDNAVGNFAFDGDLSTRWISKSYYRDEPPQWLEYDYKQPETFNKISIFWEGAYATEYKIQTSNNKSLWNTIYATSTSDGALDQITFAQDITARYVRIYMQKPATEYGYSIWECQLEHVPQNLALNKVASGDIHLPQNAFDGDMSTRWSSEPADNKWLIVNLGQSLEFNAINIYWEAAFAQQYTIKISDDGLNWNDVYVENSSDGNVDEISFVTPLTAQYVALFCTQRNNPEWGSSVWEMEIRNN